MFGLGLFLNSDYQDSAVGGLLQFAGFVGLGVGVSGLGPCQPPSELAQLLIRGEKPWNAYPLTVRVSTAIVGLVTVF